MADLLWFSTVQVNNFTMWRYNFKFNNGGGLFSNVLLSYAQIV